MDENNDILNLVGDSNSFIFNDLDNTVLLKHNVIMGYCSRKNEYEDTHNFSHEILLYIKGWTTSEILRYDNDHKSFNKDLKMLSDQFQ